MKAKGFTLVELAIVLVIIGILVAVAVPRFVDLTAQADRANVEATAAAVRSAYAIATVQVKGLPTCEDIFGNLDGGGFLRGEDSERWGTAWVWLGSDRRTRVFCYPEGDLLVCAKGWGRG